MAIEGPTPVSALIHAATLVTAGVYLMLRSSPILEYSSTTLISITFVGAITAFFASSTGLLQNDLKRVIAYSTCSQIGYLFIACGLSQYNTSLFHLINHAFFKALLFLSAGAVLHATFDQQDQRKLGGLIGFLPFAYTSILIGSLSLMAIPFLTGFYSKDLILELSYGQYLFNGQVCYYLGTISAIITAFYSIRLISITFLTYPNANKFTYSHTHDVPIIVIVVLTILNVFAIFFGYITRDLYVGICSDFLSDSLFIHPNNIILVEAEFGLSTIIKLLPLFATILGAIFAIYLYHIVPIYTTPYHNVSKNFYKFFNGKYYVDVIYNHYIIYFCFKLGYTLTKVLDKGIIELIGPYGFEKSLNITSQNISQIDTGNVTNYALYITIAILSIIFILFSLYINMEIVLIILINLVLMPVIFNNKNNIIIKLLNFLIFN